MIGGYEGYGEKCEEISTLLRKSITFNKLIFFILFLPKNHF
jgi:hypothetical protein